MTKKKIVFLIALLTLALAITACSDGGSSTLTNGSGELALSIADAPVNDVAEVNVTLDEVQVSRLEDDQVVWETINDFSDLGGEATFDLLTLRFDEELLGQEMLSAGNYNQIRLIVAADQQDGSKAKNTGKSYIVYNDGTENNIFIPSGTQTGLKINHDFTIEDGKITRLLLDADVSKIMHSAGKSGKIILRPTAIKIIDKVISGDIEGRVVADTDGDGTTEAINGYDVLVEAWSNDTKVAATVATASDIKDEETGEVIKEAGSFLLRGLEEGSYSIKIKVVDGEGNEVLIDTDGDGNKDTALYQLATTNSTNVIAEEVTTLETIILEKTIVNNSTDTDNTTSDSTN
ncbi:DUF4382 domain-containing protein [Orenia marismortui]|uniref:Uncharacterized protein DUF4382 n=1 Tax=Orenia marismortui TaxID=46469 RepID=A0A4R8H7U5_9FIRM|nr:DUF4382 domain-containing protein [Orenia marismortui]TDX51638.1 uncharacterized protein DUF4382 [Orenia marismortui]